MFQTKVVQKIKTHIFCVQCFFFKKVLLLDNVGKYDRAGQVTGDNMALAQCMLGT